MEWSDANGYLHGVNVMEWDKALVSSKVANVPVSDQNKTFHQMYQEWSSWVNPWLDSNTAPTGATIARCSLSYNGSGAGHEHSSENYIFNNIRQHEIHTDATAAWGVSSVCGDGFLCDQEVAKVWNDLNASSKVGQSITVGSKSVTFASDILDFWRGFGSSYYASDGTGKVKVLPPPESDGSPITSLTDDFAPIVDAYYAYPSVLMCSTPISLQQYVWNNARPAHSFSTYKNKDKDKHYLNCSKCGKTNIEDYHVHDGALSDTQCDLCGYRKGMPNGFEATDFTNRTSFSDDATDSTAITNSSYKTRFLDIGPYARISTETNQPASGSSFYMGTPSTGDYKSKNGDFVDWNWNGFGHYHDQEPDQWDVYLGFIKPLKGFSCKYSNSFGWLYVLNYPNGYNGAAQSDDNWCPSKIASTRGQLGSTKNLFPIENMSFLPKATDSTSGSFFLNTSSFVGNTQYGIIHLASDASDSNPCYALISDFVVYF